MFYYGIWRSQFAAAYKGTGESAAAARKRTAETLLRLRKALRWDPAAPDPNRRGIPTKSEDTLLLATWNIREFESNKYGRRLPETFYYLAEVISRFDLVAIQEVREDLAPIRRLMEIMGGWWEMLATDVTEGSRGNRERMVFLFDTRKVQMDGIAGEVVIPPMTVKTPEGKRTVVPAEQLYRTPYTCTFSARWRRFMLTTVHILYGKAVADNLERAAEIEAVAKFVAKLHKQQKDRVYDNVLLGDFNIFAPGDVTMQKMLEQGFRIPDSLKSLPGSNVAKKKKHYDQIAFKRDKDGFDATGNAGVFDFFRYVFRDPDGSDGDDMDAYRPAMGPKLDTTSSGKPRANKRRYWRDWRTFQMSDHLPMWIELKINFSDAYLSDKGGVPIP